MYAKFFLIKVTNEFSTPSQKFQSKKYFRQNFDGTHIMYYTLVTAILIIVIQHHCYEIALCSFLNKQSLAKRKNRISLWVFLPALYNLFKNLVPIDLEIQSVANILSLFSPYFLQQTNQKSDKNILSQNAYLLLQDLIVTTNLMKF